MNFLNKNYLRGFVILCIIGACVTYSDSIAQKNEKKNTERMTSVDDFPRWSKDTVKGLLDGKNSKNENLWKLDMEIDILATAFLQLEQPQFCYLLYDIYYGELEMRTPAAYLLKSKSLRMLSRLAGEAKDAQSGIDLIQRARIFTKVETAGAENALFEKRLVILVDAGKILREAVKMTGKMGDSNMGSWLNFGLPKFSNENNISDEKTEITNYEPYSPFDGMDMMIGMKEELARCCIELGDLQYRATSKPSPIVKAWYVEAHRSLYFARILDYENKNLAFLGDELDKRIKWLESGDSFGGEDYQLMSLPPVTSLNYISNTKLRLEDALEKLEVYDERERIARKEASSWAENLTNQKGDRNLLKEQFQYQMELQIRSEMSALKNQVATINHEVARDALKRAVGQLDNFYQNTSLRLSTQVYAGELKRTRGVYLDEAIKRLGEIETRGAILSLQKRLATNNSRGEWIRIKKFYENSSEPDVKKSWLAVQRLLEEEKKTRIENTDNKGEQGEQRTAGRLIAKYREEYLAAKFEREIIERTIKFKQDTKEFSSLEKHLEHLRSERDNLFKDLDSLPLEQDNANQAHRAKLEYNLYVDKILPSLEKEYTKANERVSKAREHIRKVGEIAKEARKAIETAGKVKKQVEQAYAGFEKIISKISFQPVTIQGTMSGTMIDVGGAMERMGEAALKALEKLYENMKEGSEFQKFLMEMEKQAHELDAKLAKMQSDVAKKKKELLESKLNKNIAEAFKAPQADVIRKINELRSKFISGGKYSEHWLAKAVKADRNLKKLASEIDRLADEELEKINTLSKDYRTEVEAAAAQGVEEKDRAGYLWAQAQLRRGEIDANIAKLNIRISRNSAKKQALQQANSEYSKEIEHKHLNIAIARENASLAQYEAAISDQDTAWRRLSLLVVRLNRLNNEEENLVDLRTEFKLRLEQLNGNIEGKQIVVKDSVEKLLSVEKESLLRIEMLNVQLNKLRKEKSRVMTKEILERMAPAMIAMENVGELKNEQRVLLAEANRHLVAYGRWLLMLSGDSSLIIYSSPCRSIAELRLAYRVLNRKFEKLDQSLNHSKLEVVFVKMNITTSQSKGITFEVKAVNDIKALKWMNLERTSLGLKLSTKNSENSNIKKYPIFEVKDKTLSLPPHLANSYLLGVKLLNKGESRIQKSLELSMWNLIPRGKKGNIVPFKSSEGGEVSKTFKTLIDTLSPSELAEKIFIKQSPAAIWLTPWKHQASTIRLFGHSMWSKRMRLAGIEKNDYLCLILLSRNKENPPPEKWQKVDNNEYATTKPQKFIGNAEEVWSENVEGSFKDARKLLNKLIEVRDKYHRELDEVCKILDKLPIGKIHSLAEIHEKRVNDFRQVETSIKELIERKRIIYGDDLGPRDLDRLTLTEKKIYNITKNKFIKKNKDVLKQDFINLYMGKILKEIDKKYEDK